MDLRNAYSAAVLQGMELLRREENLCDVVFDVEGKQFPCHKLVLSSVSAFFKTMFTTPLRDPDEKVIKLNFLTAPNFGLLLDYLYSGIDILNEENACTILEIANYTQIDILQEACIRYFVPKLNIRNCITIWHLGQKLCLQNLIDEAVSYVTKTLDKMINNESLLEATADDVNVMLTSDSSTLPTEDQTTEFLLRWLNHNLEHNTEETKTSIYRLLKLPLCSGEYLVSLKQNHKTIFKDREFVTLFERAVEYHLQPARASYLLSMETEQRPASEYEHVLMVFTSKSEVFAFSFRQECWFFLKRIEYSTEQYFDVCVFNASTLYVSGGVVESHVSRNSGQCLKYDGNANTWTTNTMPFCIERHSMVTVNHCLYLLAGRTKHDALLNKIENVLRPTRAVRRYDPVQDTWCILRYLPKALYDAASVVMNSKIYLIGGTYLDGSDKMVENRSILVYNVSNNVCSEIELNGYHFLKSELFVFPYNSYILILDYTGRNGRLSSDSQTFEKGKISEEVGEIDMAHLFKDMLIVFRKKKIDKNEYDVMALKTQEAGVLESGTKTLPPTPFDRSTKIIRCVNVLIKRKHLQKETTN